MKSGITIPAVVECHSRSIAKTLSYRSWGLLITVLVVLVSTGEVALALSVGLADTLIKIAVYYLHERAWTHINFGRKATEQSN